MSPLQNPEFVRLFKLVMSPMAAHLRSKGWVNSTFAYISDETRWPCYGGSNFTVNAWISMTRLYRSLDPALRVQQDLTPQTSGAVWQAVSPLVDAWIWQEGQFQFGVSSGTGAKAARIEKNLALVAEARKRGSAAYIYNNELAVVDLPNQRVRTFPWQLWRTNYAYPVSRHAGFQGSLSWYTLDGYFGSDPYKFANVLCGKPLGGSAHPIHPRPSEKPCLQERAAGEWFVLCEHRLPPCCVPLPRLTCCPTGRSAAGRRHLPQGSGDLRLLGTDAAGAGGCGVPRDARPAGRRG